MSKLSLQFELPVGLNVEGKYSKDVELLRSNAIAEEVFTTKLAEQPYTYIANVISIAVKSIGGVAIAQAVRENYLKDRTVTVPAIVKSLSLADASTLLLEIHRRVWENLLRDQRIMCKGCGKELRTDVDLDKVEMDEHNKELLKENTEFNAISCDLEYGIDFSAFIEKRNREDMNHLKGVIFNRVIFRVPTLADAIRNEKYTNKNIDFWRRITVDCIQSIECIKDGKVITEFPQDRLIWLGLDIFNYVIDAKDLKKMRISLIDELPTMPFMYEEICPCDAKKVIPIAMEASSFFSA